MDEFAQSRDDDDLFGDEFEPVSNPTIVHEQGTESNGRFIDPAGSTTETTREVTAVAGAAGRGRGDTHAQRHGRDQGQGRGKGGSRGQDRGRGRGAQGQGNGQAGRGGGGHGGPQVMNTGLAGSRYAPQQPTATTATPTTEIPSPAPAVEPTEITTATIAAPEIATILTTEGANIKDETKNDTNTDTTNTDPPSLPSEPSPQQPPTQPSRIIAVRGDRSLTGGPQHTKLSEAELTAKLARMAILNAQKSEKFRLQQADSDAFLQKEAEMRKKRAEEQKNARAMDQERAKNRERKLKAQGGREWDSEKLESDIVDGRRARTSEYVRGGHGGVIKDAGLGASRYADADTEGPREEGRSSRGRGGFEIRGRGRGGRGGRGGGAKPPTVPTDADFPSLPTPTKSTAPIPRSVAVGETTHSPTDEKPHDWAEEMATPVEEEKMDV